MSVTLRSTFAVLALALAACADDPASHNVAPDAAPDSDVAPDSAPDSDVAPDSDAPPDSDDTPDTTAPPIDLALVPAVGEVVAGIADKPADLVGGPKAEGQLGDLVLANHRARFLVEAARPAGGYRQYGGNLVDADLQPGGNDRFGELWLVWNLRAFQPDQVVVVSDGRDGLAVVRATGRLRGYAWVDAVLGGLLVVQPIDVAVTYEYRLAPDSDRLTFRVVLDNDGAETADVRLPIIAMNMGDGAPAFTPGPGLASIAGGTSWPWTGGVGLSRAYGFVPPADMIPVALFQETNVQLSQLPSFELAPGESTSLDFTWVVSDSGTTAIEAARAELHDVNEVALSGRVSGEAAWLDDEDAPSNTGGRSWVAVSAPSGQVLALTPVTDDGTWRALVPPGDVTVQAFAPGRGASATTTVSALADATVDLELPALGELVARVRDPEGAVIPAQVTVFRVAAADGTTAPIPFAPEPVGYDADWGRGRSAVLYHVGSQAVTHLLPGDYRVVASRGFSWEIDERAITIAPGTSTTVDLVLEKVVDDSGWTAADPHVHAFWSPDAEVPYVARLRQAAANDLTLPIFTEHTYMGDLAAPRIEAGVDALVTPIPGQEVSTVEYGHFGAFPLLFDAAKPSGGAVFEHGWVGAGLFDAMRAQHAGDILVQVNHPRVSTRLMAYFTAIGLDTQTLVAADKPDRWTDGWDTIEVFNEGCGPGGGNAQSLQDWFNLNDLGLEKTLSSGSDSHSEASGLGNPRSWIAVSKEAVDADRDAIVAPFRARHAFVSCGPFVRFVAEDGTDIGGHTQVGADGKVRFTVRVEAPSWMAIDRVRLLENGVPVADVALADWARPEGLAPAVRYADTLVAEPVADAWYVVEVIGSGGLGPIDAGENPYAMTNPIDVDDGDDVWTPPAESGTTRPQNMRSFPIDTRPHHHH